MFRILIHGNRGIIREYRDIKKYEVVNDNNIINLTAVEETKDNLFTYKFSFHVELFAIEVIEVKEEKC